MILLFKLMSYEPLHYKYRFQTFTDLVGQDTIPQENLPVRTRARHYMLTKSDRIDPHNTKF